MQLTDLSDFLERVRAHNRETGHEIITCNNVLERLLGYSCADCEDLDGTQWNQFQWEISLPDMRRTLEAAQPILNSAGLALNTPAMLDWMNEHTRDRFFEAELEPEGIIPLTTMEPEAGDMAWAHEHINMPLPPRERR